MWLERRAVTPARPGGLALSFSRQTGIERARFLAVCVIHAAIGAFWPGDPGAVC
jgi:hypothetical protein